MTPERNPAPASALGGSSTPPGPEYGSAAAQSVELQAPIRVVRWIDSALQNVQVHVSEIPKPEEITSVGFLVKEEDDYLVLARDDHKDDEWRGLCSIPRCSILEVRDA